MSQVDFSAIESIDDCIPADTNQINSAYQFGSNQSPTTETAIRDAMTIVSIPEPMHLGYCAGNHPIFSQGCWFVDLAIDRLQDNSRYSNIREKWVLPSCPQLVRQFCGSTSARLSKYGSISVRADSTKRVVEITQPGDEAIFRCILNDRPHYSHLDMRTSLVKNAAYKYSAPSDKGKYLQGMLGIFGSLSSFENVLGNHFWRSQFERMATPAQEQQEEVIRDLKLRMKAKDGTMQINDDAGWQKLAKRIIQKANSLRVPRQKTSFNKLLCAWKLELNAAVVADVNLNDRHDEILAEAPDELKRSLSFLLERNVFYRGHEWSCRHCLHRNWASVGFLKDTMQCEVCREEHQLPIDVSLDFRLNEFFATCLREHDTITVAWALSALREQSINSFIFAPQTALYRDFPENQGGKSDRELDVVCIVNGKFVIGEVKASVASIEKSDIEDLASAAKELGADVAILMAMSGDAGLMNEKVIQLRALLPVNIETKCLVSNWDNEPSACL
jgi:hypothetical protein